MEKNKTQQTATGRSASADWERREEMFTLWDALDLAFEENHPPDILKSLLKAFSGLDAEMQVAALRRLGEKGRQLPDDLKKGVISYFLAKHLEDSRAEVRIAAVEAVGMLTRQALAETLAAKLVSDESTSVRIASAEALGELVESMMLRAFKGALSDSSWEVRAAAIQTLGKLGKRLIIEPLQIALGDQDFSVSSAALHALGIFKGSLSTKYLVSLAKEKTKDWITRDAAVTALERAGDYARVKSLRASLDRALERETGFMEHEETQVPTQQLKERFLPWSIGREKVAYVWKKLRKYGEEVLSRCKEKPLILLLPFSILGGLFASIFLFHAWKQLKKYREEILLVLLPLFPTIGGFFNSIFHSHAWKQLEKYGKSVFSHSRGLILAIVILCFFMGLSSLGFSYAIGNPTTLTVKTTTQHYNASLRIIAQPESVAPGQTFLIRLAAINGGSTIWTDTKDYRLVCSSDNREEVGCMGFEEMTINSSSVSRAGRTYTFVIALTAPPTSGTYTLRWTMFHDDGSFGNSLSIQIRVLQAEKD